MIKSYKGINPKLNQGWIAENATIIGNVICEKKVSIWYNAILRGDEDQIWIEEGTNVQDGVVIHCDQGFPVHIQKGCTIGHNAIIHGCSIGENTIVGMGATILNGAKIGKNCIIGANALVAQGKEIPDCSLVVGMPGKVIRELDKKQIAGNIENAKLYIELSKEQLKEVTQ